METLKQDIRYGVRMLLRSPGFTAIAILTLALGIGANVAIFTFVNAVLLRPLPFTHPEQLVRIFDDLGGTNLKNVGMSVPEMEDLRDRSGVFDGLTAIWPVSAALTGGDHPERIELMVTSPSYFHLLGAKPQLGRVYGPEDATPGFSDAALISDGLWKRQFGKDPNILGKKIRIDTDLYTVVGVMPAGFEHPGETVQGNVDIYAACGYSANPFPTPPKRSQNFLPGAIGRLKAGMSVAQAQAQVDAFAAHLREAYPNDYPAVSRWSLRLEPVQENLTGKVRTTLLVLLTAVGFVLLIACVNIASLLLARSSGRIRELAVRRALGAARGRIVRQLLTESLLLAVAGGATALAVLFVLGDSLVALMPTDLPRLNEVHFDLRVVGFAFLLSLVTGIVFGLLPALHAADADPNQDLKLGNRTGGGGAHQNRFRSALVTAEIALSLMLLIAAGLLVRSFWDTLQVRPGFEPKNLVVAQIWIPVPNNPAMNPYLKPADRSAFVREVLRRVSALPGVEEAAIGSGNSIPFVNVRNSFPIYFSDDPNAGGARLQAEFASVTPRYLDTVKAPLVAGRFFTDSDSVGSQPVMVVNETFVKRYSAAREAVGRRVRFVNGNGPDLTIVGVVGDLHDDGLDAPGGAPYLSIHVSGPGICAGNLSADFGSSGNVEGGGDAAGARGESGTAGFRRADDGRIDVGVDGAAEICAGIDGAVRGGGAAAGGTGNIRRDGLCGDAANAGNWNPHGAGSAATGHFAAGAAARADTDRDRSVDWTGGSSGHDAIDCEFAVWRDAYGPGYFYWSAGGAGSGGAGGLLDSSAPGHQGGSNGCASL